MATRARKVDPQDARRVRHTRIGVWDLYEDLQTDFPRKMGLSRSKTYAQIVQTMPYIARMFKDILSIRRARMLLPAFLAVEVLESLLPAISLWYSGQLLHLTETVIETHAVDTTVLIHVAVGRVGCAVVGHLLRHARTRIKIPLNMCIKQFYDRRMFHSIVRLDLPTFEDSAIQRQLDFTLDRGSNVPWDAVWASTSLAMMGISLLSQFSVLFTILREQQDGPLLVILGFSRSMFRWYSRRPGTFRSLVWAATTTDKDYIRMEGLKNLATDPSHRKELVAGNVDEYITSQFRESAQRVGDDAGEFEVLYQVHSVKKRLSILPILRDTMHELPQIAFTLRAMQKPMTIPLSLASLALIEHASTSFMSTHFSTYGGPTIATNFADVRDLYEIENVRNKVVDGTEPYLSLKSGISVEFRNVSFQYPDEERYALRNVSFKIEASQLCVIVGGNGSGKSTILKLISRIYDPTEGSIFIDNRDIKTLRLANLRAAMSVLFQDYTHFPLSISENIGLGNPVHAHDGDKIREAARLGGAEEFIDELPDGFDTYVNCPVDDRYAGLHEGAKTPFGWPVDYSLLRNVGGLRVSATSGLSGGQNQRLAVHLPHIHALLGYRDKLFRWYAIIRRAERFSGSYSRTRYMDESVQEQGSHDELIKKGGEYARIWNLQAKPFL
ncbi:P-loop containing nucleoside triphosphate hydrolase protein [Suillus placidus]|uniref:P-loop containing nucleoside triphosphate hydrolase protein n=1 Tax=Suillus placidus TaxID=48579 RepID=A0A9P6ZV04_9AGAM|nr:P-loop containing nucleoside triphosphate hydrolase protein [Suillus placidus]